MQVINVVSFESWVLNKEGIFSFFTTPDMKVTEKSEVTEKTEDSQEY